MSSSLSPRVVLVTGCTVPGIGTALSEQFALQGCTVYALSQILDTTRRLGNVNVVSCDSGYDVSVEGVVREIMEKHGRIDILVNNTGAGRTGALMDQPLDAVKRDFSVGVFDVLRMTQAVVPHMAKRKHGLVVNIGSMGGHIAAPWGGISSSAKSALHSLTDTLDMELRPLGVHVTLLVPGLLETHIRSNPSAAVIPEHSLYGDFRTHVSDRLAVSLHMPAMPTEEFARRAVDELLKPRPPRYLSLGGLAWQVELLRWLPRGLVLFLLWLQFFKLPSILRMLRIL